MGEFFMNKKSNYLYILSFLLTIMIFVSACKVIDTDSKVSVETNLPDESLIKPEEISNEQEQKEEDNEVNGGTEGIEDIEYIVVEPTISSHAPKTSLVHIMAVGDIMMHMPQVNSGRTSEGYDFTSFFKDVKPLFSQADLVLGNLETTLSGADLGYSGFPRFNSPNEVADALKEAGFNVITTANNHSIDKGEKGVLRTLEQLDRVGLSYTGTFRSEKDREQILMVTKNEISIAILAYTYSTNGLPIPNGKEYLVNLLDAEKMKKDIENAKNLGADIVAVAMHFGHEYHRHPSENQKEWVDQLFDWGVDLIFGSHPHVLQPYEFREWITEEGAHRQGLVIYSLGNFISNQREEPNDIGGIMSVQIQKTGNQIKIKEVQFIPTWVHRFWLGNKRGYRILPMEEMLEVRDYPELSDQDYLYLEKRYSNILQHVTLLE
jgi:poly-gamma-glutamate capsule biosynthesis protein CapA/YwtB (metallophosphatase superfamily)